MGVLLFMGFDFFLSVTGLSGQSQDKWCLEPQPCDVNDGDVYRNKRSAGGVGWRGVGDVFDIIYLNRL